MTSKEVHAFLDRLFQSSRTAFTLNELDRMIKQKLRTDMRNRDAVSRIRDLFTTYHTILKRNDVECLIRKN